MKLIPRSLACVALLLSLLGACSNDTGTAVGVGGGKSTGVWFEGGFDDALKQARATNRLVFIDFWTSWCGFCKKLDKVTFPDPGVQAELAQMVALSVDAESPAGIPLAARYRATGFPTLVVVDADGREVGRIAGFMEPEPFAQKLAEIRARVKR